jgi:hypothetical protein
MTMENTMKVEVLTFLLPKNIFGPYLWHPRFFFKDVKVSRINLHCVFLSDVKNAGFSQKPHLEKAKDC